MQGKGLLVAAAALIVVGLLGTAAAGAYLASEEARRATRAPRADEGRRPGEEATRTPAPRRAPRRRFPRGGDFSSAGERIWYTGVGEEGPIPREPSFGPAMMGGCAVCHGEDGRGSRFYMMGRTFDAPDIRYSTLTSEHTEDGETEEAWTDEDIARAVREGVDPGGEDLEDTMPRWDITGADLDALLEHMRALDGG
ncbi:MAG: c-type cytochrome [Coriobacteriia bacterium]|nr:c-type cytochrome [Coriobacteriia bacterium]